MLVVTVLEFKVSEKKIVNWVSGSTEVVLSFGIVERTVGGVESVVVKDQLVFVFLSRGLPDSSVIEPYTRITV